MLAHAPDLSEHSETACSIFAIMTAFPFQAANAMASLHLSIRP
jgi:hypothetical protein